LAEVQPPCCELASSADVVLLPYLVVLSYVRSEERFVELVSKGVALTAHCGFQNRNATPAPLLGMKG